MKLKFIKAIAENLDGECDIYVEQTDDYKAVLLIEDMEGNKVQLGDLVFEPMTEK